MLLVVDTQPLVPKALERQCKAIGKVFTYRKRDKEVAKTEAEKKVSTDSLVYFFYFFWFLSSSEG
jgi:hypothetical protein